jgi:hypothetical protein
MMLEEFDNDSFDWIPMEGLSQLTEQDYLDAEVHEDVNDENVPVQILDPPVEALTPAVATKYGLLAAAWVAFLESVSQQTKAPYSMWVIGLVLFAAAYISADQTVFLPTEPVVIVLDAVLPYLQKLWAQKTNGRKTYCANSMKSFLSSFIKFFQYAHGVDLLQRRPVIVAILKGWLTHHEPRKASTFTKEQLRAWLDQPHDPESLIRKVCCTSVTIIGYFLTYYCIVGVLYHRSSVCCKRR